MGPFSLRAIRHRPTGCIVDRNGSARRAAGISMPEHALGDCVGAGAGTRGQRRDGAGRRFRLMRCRFATCEALPGASRAVRTPDAPVAGLVRRDAGTVALTFSRRSRCSEHSLRRRFRRLCRASRPQLRLQRRPRHHRQDPPAPGCARRSSRSPASRGRSATGASTMRDAASYYGLGERFDTLDHAHTVIENLSTDNEGVKGTSSYKPIPFFMSGHYRLRPLGGHHRRGHFQPQRQQPQRNQRRRDRREAANPVLFTGASVPAILSRTTALARRSPIRAPLLGLRTVEGARLPPERRPGSPGRRPQSRAGPACKHVLIDSPWAYHLQQLQVRQPEAVRRACYNGQVHPRAGRLQASGILAHAPG